MSLKNSKKYEFVNVIGAGLAGCEAALYLAQHGIKVNLFEMKPKYKTPAHKNDNFGELVCSNSLKSIDENTASGLLKKELGELDCSLLKIAKSVAVPAGTALAVDREKFSDLITKEIYGNKNITVVNEKIDQLNLNELNIVATGPLTDENLYLYLQELIGKNNCYFYDAIAPIIYSNSLDFNYAFWGDRYGKGGSGDYINCVLNKEQYSIFVNELINAETAQLKEFEKVFESCMPIEIMAKRGFEALRFGSMKPVGLFDTKKNERPYAVVQLRKEDEEGKLVNLVGFQTNLKYKEQKRVFSLIPALKNAEFVRFGQMHRNSYINSPYCLNFYSQLKQIPNIFIAGQLSGVEGYVESIASGLYVAINAKRYLENKTLEKLSTKTCMGAIFNYISQNIANNFQPMNANYGIITCEEHFRDKQKKREYILKTSLSEIKKFKEKIYD